MAPSDAHARFRRMQGYNVLHPIGFDAFGLPAENAAISRGIHPYEWTMSNVDNMRRQLRSIGAVYDWDREVVCCLPEYYRWNQWFFIKLYEQGLAYRAKAPVVWCPSCQTVLANEQVLNGVCERCDTSITRRDLEQWFLRITDYADQLLDFDTLEDWPDKILTMQRNWIGRSEGVEIGFDISENGLDEREIKTFTTRIDTIFGVTFLVLAPEHPLVPLLTSDSRREEVEAYIAQARGTSEIDRLSTDKDKTGVFIGSYARNRFERRTSADLHCRLRAHHLWHGRRDGRAGSRLPGLGVRAQVSVADSHGHRTHRMGRQRTKGCVPWRRIHDQFRRLRRYDRPGGYEGRCRRR